MSNSCFNLANERTQRAAFDKFRSDVMLPASFAEIVYGQNIGMIERAGGAGFALKTRDAVGIVRQLGWQRQHVSAT
jgi:hypothetical protein